MEKVRIEPGFNLYLPDEIYEEFKKVVGWGQVFRTIHQMIYLYTHDQLDLDERYIPHYKTRKCGYRRINLPLEDWYNFRKKTFPKPANRIVAGLIHQFIRTNHEKSYIRNAGRNNRLRPRKQDNGVPVSMVRNTND